MIEIFNNKVKIKKMMKQTSIMCLLILFAVAASADNDNMQQKDLCEMQNKINEVVKRFTPRGQLQVKNLFLNYQNEFSNVLGKMYANIKANNADTLANLTATEGDNITPFWNAIGFNNDPVFSKQQLVDLCKLKSNVVSAIGKLSPLLK